MTFIDALRTGRPMRRPFGPNLSPWLVLGTQPDLVTGKAPCWRVMETGQPAALHRYDYLAEDWQVMQ